MGNKEQNAYPLSHNYRFHRSQRNSCSLSVSMGSPDFSYAALAAADWEAEKFFPKQKSIATSSIPCKIRNEGVHYLF